MAEIDFKKVKHSRKQDDGSTVLISEWTSTDTVECTDGTTLTDKLGTVIYYDEQSTGTITSQSEVIREEDVVDNLTSTATNKPLSANQGTVLNASLADLVTTVSNDTINKKNDSELTTNSIWNDYTANGIYSFNTWTGVKTGSNYPTNSDFGVLIVARTDSYLSQVCYGYDHLQRRVCRLSDGVWSAWREN